MLTEQIVHSALLVLHNIALVGCAAAPFYNRNLVVNRGQYGPKLHYELDKVVEDTLQGNVPYCVTFIAVLFATGIGMPINYYAFHGALRTMNTVVYVALALKLLCVFAMMVIMAQIFLGLNPRLRVLFAKFEPGKAPDPAMEKEFFQKRAKRKALCEICLWFALGVLLFSAFLGFNV